MKQASILLADNHPELLEATSEYLEEHGFRVFPASSQEEAQRLIENEHLHLAVLDMRLSDDHDPLDKSGLQIAQSVAPSLPKIIWTRFTTDYRIVVETLRAEAGRPPAVDFVNKLEGEEVLLSAIQNALTTHVNINETLDVQWETALSFSQLVMIVNPVSPELHINRVAEFQDLFGKLFFENTQITIGQILTHDQERVILSVYAYDSAGIERQYLVSCGCREAILHEHEQCYEVVPQSVSIHTIGERTLVDTVRFAAIAYPFMGDGLEETISFRLYHQSRPIAQVTDLVFRLYNDNLSRWYERGLSQERRQPLSGFYERWLDFDIALSSQDEWQTKIESICHKALATGLFQIDFSNHQLKIHQKEGPPIDYPNPVTLLDSVDLAGTGDAIWGITHGKVIIDTILVDQKNKTWLLDFAHVAKAPLLCDFVMLETSIKLDLMKETDCQQRLNLEIGLLQMDTLTTKLDRRLSSSAMSDLADIVSTIRYSAARLTNCDWQDYLRGLFFCMWQRISHFEPQKLYNRRALTPYVHAVLATAVLSNRLNSNLISDLPKAALQSLWLDSDNQTVWVEGESIELTSQEFLILKYLYAHSNQVCDRMDILNQAFIVDDLVSSQDITFDEGRLNSAMSRLRLKIEPHAEKNNYLITVRGRGYKLQI